MDPQATILVVDDNVELAENLAEILASVGYPTTVAASAEEARELIRARRCRALITDYRLPGKSGADLIGELRQARHEIPVVMMSAYTDPAMVEHAEAAGALEVLAKPVDIPRLLELVAAIDDDRSRDQVLVVDDNRDLADNIAEALRACGLQPLVGNTAGEALSHRRRVGAALIDLRLPDQSGLHVAQRLRARFPATRILLISAHCDDRVRRQVDDLLPGIQCLEKPLDLQQLLVWVRGAAAGEGKPPAGPDLG